MIKKLLFLLALSPGLNAQNGIANFDFENWNGALPVGFIGTGVSQKVASPYSGIKYARVTSNGSAFPNTAGYMVLAGNSNVTMPGVPVATTPTSVVGYIRTNLVGTDTVYILGHLRKNPSTIVGSFFLSITQSYTNWQQVIIPINYFSQLSPDTIQLTFIANKSMLNMRPPGSVGTYLEVDKFSLDEVSVATSLMEFSNSSVAGVYPNPASQQLFIDTRTLQGRVEVYSFNGSLLNTADIDSELTRLDVDLYPTGIYLYKILDNKGNALRSGKFSVAR